MTDNDIASAAAEARAKAAEGQPADGGAGASPNATPAAQPATDPLAEAQAESLKWKDLAARNQAELENYRKRVAREREDDMKRTRAGLLEDLLPVIDNFELGMMEVRKGDPKSPIVIGMEMIERQLRDFMSNAGVEAIGADGLSFDPNVHEAVSQEESADVPEGKVIRQVRKGYKLRDRLLRPAMVVVSKGASA
jgi:molecular chaperone GrpE